MLVYLLVMIRINIHDAKTNLSRHLRRVARGETIIVCRHNVPIAELRPITQPTRKPRLIGGLAGKLRVPRSFFEPLPDDVIDAFEGGRRAR